MEKRVVVFISSLSMICMIGCFLLLSAVPGIHAAAMAVAEQGENDNGKSMLAMLRDDSEVMANSEDYLELKKHQLRLEIPSTVDAKRIKVSGDYMNKGISITIPGIGNTYFYDYPMIGNSDHIDDLYYEVEDSKGIINLSMDNVYECVTTPKDKYLYIDFKAPKDVYKYVVVIDAGHGGRAPGANQGDVLEKNIVLDIVKELKVLFDKDEHDIKAYYTRLDDTNPDFPERVGIANKTKADAFVSVHINSTSTGRTSSINGTAVMYRSADKTKESKKLAENCLNGMLEKLGSQSKGLIVGDEIYIIRKSKVPVALCEVGFITNPNERYLLLSQSYQQKAAEGIYNGILKSIGIAEGE